MSGRNRWSFLVFQVATAALAFATYFCMYAFRKPFAASVYEGNGLFGLDPKTVLVISQVIGYTLSKYVSVKVVSETERENRAPLLIGLIFSAEVALIGFAFSPPWLQPGWMFLNGLPLGMVWGLVVRYLEGRRSSEFLLSGLSCSFIVASGVVKDIGRWLLSEGVSVDWMPALVGAGFFLPFIASAVLLDRCPDPDAEDISRREVRLPMHGPERRKFARDFLPGVALLLVVYLVLTAFRDFRDNYGVELFTELGYGDVGALFTMTEIPIAVIVLVLLAMLGWLQGRRSGLVGVFVVMIVGLVTIAGSTLALDLRLVSGELWMIGIGLGAYLAYVPFSSFLFDRIMAATRFTGTAVFAVNLADAVGYTGSVAMQLFKDLGHGDMSRLQFFRGVSYLLGVGGAVILGLALFYFVRQAQQQPLPSHASR